MASEPTKKTFTIHATSPAAAKSSRYGVLIANWNGDAFIERCLGSVLAAARHYGESMEIMVTDDASRDSSPRLIAENFPSMRLYAWQKNVGYARSVLRGARAMQCDWLFLLNNDLALNADFFRRMIGTLESSPAPERVFAIGARTRDWESQADNHGGQRAARASGMIVQRAFDAEIACATDFFQAGACLVNRHRFLALGGMAAIYHPGYWEDYDLAWRALRMGWVNLYEPRAVAYHAGKSSMSSLVGRDAVSDLVRRNHIIFNWLSVEPGSSIAAHLLNLPRVVLSNGPERRAAATTAAENASAERTRPTAWGYAFFMALTKLPAVLRLRRKRLQTQITDQAGNA